MNRKRSLCGGIVKPIMTLALAWGLTVSLGNAEDQHGRTPTASSSELRQHTEWARRHLFNSKPRLPFSFTYGGRDSGEFLAAWPGTTARRKRDEARTEHTRAWTFNKDDQDGTDAEWPDYVKNRPKPAPKTSTGPSSAKPNILFIAIDDLKPLLGCYGSSWIRSPNIDLLASRGTLFTASYCQVSFCAPSRMSVLTGLRPDTTRVVFNPPQQQDILRTRFPDLVTLPQHFKINGWLTCGMGKVFDGRTVDKGDDTASWSVPYVRKFEEAAGGLGVRGFQNPATKKRLSDALAASPSAPVMGPPTEGEDVPDNGYYDGAMAFTAAAKIREFGKGKQPFFLAVGFVKPHLPFIAPKPYWDLYDRATLPLAPFQQLPQGSPHDLAFYSNSGELRDWHGVPKAGPIEEAMQRELIHGYAACVSYIDAQVGLLMKTLEETGIADNTIICLWGDHGWHLGEHGHWGKVTNYEDATHAPLILSTPGQKSGNRITTPVEFLDIYPTLCNLADLPRPAHLQGVSLVSAMRDASVISHEAAISQMSPGASKDGVMGWTLRTPRYRYIEWRRADLSTDTPRITGQTESIELYDYETDPLERENLAAKTEHAAVLTEQKDLFDKLLPHLPKRLD